ncbi:MAG TPA: MerR family transcriptional regulator [Kofleriaceae bacterium]|nr:MerR family transcriptional regulator [Kofleriaceae bacterium]
MDRRLAAHDYAPQMAAAVARDSARKRAKRVARRTPKRGKPTRPETELIKMSELSKRSSVPAPTIKHYIREGLLPGPEVRTSRNMAYYDARMVGRIRVIKELQAERFLPLRVIGELLEPPPSDRIRADRDAAQRRALTQLAPVVEDRLPANHRRKRTEVMKTFGLSKAELDGLEKAGVLELRGEGETAGYSGVDLVLLDILADVRRLGLGDVFPVSIAEPYLAAVKKLVELEIDIFRHRVLASGTPENVADVARHAVALGERLISALRAKLLPGMLERLATA